MLRDGLRGRKREFTVPSRSTGRAWAKLIACAFACVGLSACLPVGDGQLGSRCQGDQDCNVGLVCPGDGIAHVSGFCTQRQQRRPLNGYRQWAAEATATSFLDIGLTADVSSDASSDSSSDGGRLFVRGDLFTPAKARGAPDTPLCAFVGTCWTPAAALSGIQVLTTRYDRAVHAFAIEVVENQNPGSVVKVELIEEEDSMARTVWEGKDDTRACPGFLALEFDETTYLTREVRVHLDTDHRPKNVPFANERVLIDAVALLGKLP